MICVHSFLICPISQTLDSAPATFVFTNLAPAGFRNCESATALVLQQIVCIIHRSLEVKLANMAEDLPAVSVNNSSR